MHDNSPGPIYPPHVSSPRVGGEVTTGGGRQSLMGNEWWMSIPHLEFTGKSPSTRDSWSSGGAVSKEGVVHANEEPEDLPYRAN